MTKDTSVLLSSPHPTTVVPAEVHISHVQLRDLVICPREAGVVNYVHRKAIVEHNLKASTSSSALRTVAELDFTPNSLTSLPVGAGDVLIAAGGQDGTIHLSYQRLSPAPRRKALKTQWSVNDKLNGSINNSVLLTSLSLTDSNESSVEPRIGVSNNDCTVRMYDVPIRSERVKHARRGESVLPEVGKITFDVPINQSSISPDGRTLLSVGDSSKVYLHGITGGARVSFSHIATLSLPPPSVTSFIPPSIFASFSTAFSSDGMKFVVGSQEGVVAIWDVRSSNPVKVYHTDKPIEAVDRTGNGSASGWISDDPWLSTSWFSDSPWDWYRGSSRGPGWSVRNVKFSGSSALGGNEVLSWTEHTDLVHVVDGRTFEGEQAYRVPCARYRSASPNMGLRSSLSVPAATPPRRPRFLQPPGSAPYPLRRLNHTSNSRPVLSFISPRSNSRSRSSSPRRPSHSTPASRPQSAQSPRLVISSPTHSPPASGSRAGVPLGLVQALRDTFRIPTAYSTPPLAAPSYSPPASIGDSTWRTLHGVGRRMSPQQSSPMDQQDDQGDVLIIPPLGDLNMENDIHSLLQIHGIATRASSTSVYDDDVDVHEDGHEEWRLSDDPFTDGYDSDEGNTDSMASRNYRVSNSRSSRTGGQRRSRQHFRLEDYDYECLSSHASSRAASPPPGVSSVPFPLSTTSGQRSDSGSSRPRRRRECRRSSGRHEILEDDGDTEDQMRADGRDVESYFEDSLDLAGLCFDPSGEKMYVASIKSVAEWTVQGGDKTWWSGGGWM